MTSSHAENGRSGASAASIVGRAVERLRPAEVSFDATGYHSRIECQLFGHIMRYALPVVVLVVLTGVFAKGLFNDPRHIPSPLIGKTAPQFDLPRLKNYGEKLSNKDLSGQVVLFNAWASWCPPCWREHPFLMELANSQSVPIFGLNYRDDYDNAMAMIEELGNPYVASGYDEDGHVGIDFGIYGAPETFLIDSDGTILYKHASPLTREVWEREFLPRIAKAGADALPRRELD